MTLSADHIAAFLKIVETGSFSQAASALHVTQSALSQRMKALEDDLDVSLIIRDPTGARTTAAGEELLRYAKLKTRLEDETVATIKQSTSSLAGYMSVGAMSTAMRSLALPCIAILQKQAGQASKALRFDLATREVSDLHKGLARGAFDLIITDQESGREDMHDVLLGHENNVLIEAAGSKTIPDVYFDHDAADDTTARYFARQKGKAVPLQRLFLDEIYSIIDAVELGLGRAVVPLHLIASNKKVRAATGQKPMPIAVYATTIKQPYATRLQATLLKTLQEKAKALYGPLL